MIIISLQSAWHIVRPQSPELYGFAFGLYDLAQFLFTPIMSALSDIVGIKPTLVIAVLLNVIGNVIYAFVMYAGGHHGEDSKGEEIVGTWYLIIIGRFVAGIGSSAMGLGVVCVREGGRVQTRVANEACPLLFTGFFQDLLHRHLQDLGANRRPQRLPQRPGWTRKCATCKEDHMLCSTVFSILSWNSSSLRSMPAWVRRSSVLPCWV